MFYCNCSCRVRLGFHVDFQIILGTVWPPMCFSSGWAMENGSNPVQRFSCIGNRKTVLSPLSRCFRKSELFHTLLPTLPYV